MAPFVEVQTTTPGDFRMGKSALVFLLLVAAAAATFFLLSTDPEPGGTDPGGATGSATTGGGGPADLKSQVGNGNTEKGNSGEENRESVRGRNADTPPADGLVALSGRLVSTDGSSVARKLFYRESFGLPGDLNLPEGMARGVTPSAIAGASDESGRFVIRVKPERNGSLYLDGKDVVLAKATSGSAQRVKVGREDTDLGDLTIVQAGRIVGRVVGDGRGVEGVEILVGRGSGIGGSGIGLGFGGGGSVKSDSEGAFTVEGLVPGPVTLDTRSPEYLPAKASFEIVAGETKSDVLIRLQQGGVITGTVVDDLGNPIDGATVSAARDRKLSPGIQYSGFSRGESTTTDASGMFRLAGLSNATVQVRADKEGFSVGEIRNAASGETKLVLTLRRLGKLSGILVDEQGKGISGSDVSAVSSGTQGMILEPRSTVKTDAEGKFVIEGVAAGANRVVASGRNHLEAEAEADVRPGEMTEDVRITARLGSILTVTVLDDQGQPVVGAEVVASTPGDSNGSNWTGAAPRGAPRQRNVRRSVRRERRNGRTITRILGGAEKLGSAQTDENGVAVIGGLPAGDAVVEATHKDLALAAPGKAVIPDGGEVAAELRMERGGFVSVRVVDQQGEALPQSSVSVIGPLGGLAADEEPARATHSADSEGKITVGPLKPGSYKAVLQEAARVRSAGAGMSFSIAGDNRDLEDSSEPFAIKASETSELKLVMPVLTTVTGTVSDAEGPVHGAEVELLGEGEVRMPMMGRHKTKTDAEGRFELTGLASGKYTLSYNRTGAVVPSEKELVFAKNQAAHEEFLTLAGAVVKLQVKDAAGGYGVEDAKVKLTRYQPPTPGGAAPPPRRVMMIGMTLDSGGAGPSTFRMSSGDTAIQTDDEGRAEIRDVPAGKYTLTIEHNEYAKSTKIVQVGGNQAKDVGVIPVTPGCKLRGKVEFEAAGPLNMCTVEIRNDTGARETTFSRDGTFRFTGLAAGSYKVRAQPVGSQTWGPEKQVVLNPESTERVTLTIPKD